MKIAILSDLHGNLPALTAVLDHAKKLGVDEYILVGDYITDGPYVDEILDIVKNLSAYVIKGNRESYILNYKPENDHHLQHSSITRAFKQVSSVNLEYITSLPSTMNLCIEGVTIHIEHVPRYFSKHTNSPLIDPDIDKILDSSSHDIEIFGHSHKPAYVQRGTQHIINPGSVGLHVHNNTNASYAMLALEKGERPAVEIIYVKYDIDQYIQSFHDHGMLGSNNYWTKSVVASCTTGKNVCVDFLVFAYKYAYKMAGKEFKTIPNNLWIQAGKKYFNE